MREMIPFLKENDRDNKELKSFKQFITKITGIEEVEGETITDVINNYSGESGGSFEPTILYNGNGDMLYHDKEYTNVVTYDEAPEIYEKGPVVVVSSGYYYYITTADSMNDYSSGVPKTTYRFESGNMWFHSQER